ncbi:AmmeMemoRadiSam system protein A [bacterium]|nr:AmmeMemoRadiSam system protein A [bacterium]
MEPEKKKRLLVFARQVLENELKGTNHNLELFDTPEFIEKRGLFVSLHLKGNLRGCIGRIEPKNSIYDNIIDLSKAAAFDDHRFNNLTLKELEKVRIEISILTVPKKVEGLSSYEKIMKIRPKKDGVILSANHQSATFLPQVWESLPIREDFIGSLCRKAGLPGDYWENNNIDLSVYQVEHFEEQ